MQKPSPGRIVFYHFLDGGYPEEPKTRLLNRPAIVTSIDQGGDGMTVNLVVFFEAEDIEIDARYKLRRGTEVHNRYAIETSEGKDPAPETWSWPPRV